MSNERGRLIRQPRACKLILEILTLRADKRRFERISMYSRRFRQIFSASRPVVALLIGSSRTNVFPQHARNKQACATSVLYHYYRYTVANLFGIRLW